MVLAVLGLIPSLLFAALCDDTYNLQSVSQTLETGTNPANLDKAYKTVAANLSNLDIISSSANYKFIVKFDGSCGKAPKAVVFRQKHSGQTTFTDTTDNSYQIQMFDSTTKVDVYQYTYWFGFYQPADQLIAYIGRDNAKSTAFVNSYAVVSFIDSVHDTSGLWKVNSGYVGPSGPADSSSLHNRLLEATNLKNVTQNANRKIHFTVQMLQMSYENKPAPVSLVFSKKIASGFHATQTGNLVLIQPGEKGVGASEPLSLYGMMGNKIAALHPTGYMYQWNGKTSAGADCPTGVYFVQAGNRILGKFFYTR